MILADKLIDLRKKNGWSQEELAEKMEVSRQSISKWEGAQSVPDMARIVRLSELFGVSTDYLLKDEMEKEDGEEAMADASSYRTVNMEEANAFLRMKERNSRQIAIGVMLCILSPVILILLSGAQALKAIAISEMQAVGIGLVVWIAMIGGAVALFVACSIRSGRFAHLEMEHIETLYGVDGMVRDRKDKFQPTYARQLIVGIVLCVVAVVPMFATYIMSGSEMSIEQVVSVAALLVMVSFGVLLIVHCAVIWGSFQMLLEEGDYSREAKQDRIRHGNFGKVYWLIVTALYLAWSFLSGNWDRTLIVWPVAAVAYGAVFGIMKALRKKDG